MSSYIDEIKELAEKVKEITGIDIFKKAAKGRVPSQVSGEFITNREQGDWAEDLFLKIVNEKCDGLTAISYGRGENLIAGDPDFKEFFEKYQEELINLGKCPDLLIFKNEGLDEDIKGEISSDKPRKDIIGETKKSIAAIEVRSSAFLSKKYEKYRSEHETKGRAFLSFTPKIEDLGGILRWVENHEVPHYYAQVFFDRIYLISFKKILEILTNPENNKTKYFIEKNYKNRFKDTIHIALTEGICLSNDVKQPKHLSVRKPLVNGRLVHHVKFEVEELPNDFDVSAFKEVLGI
ncbi:MAG: AccI family restriction endonuclease [Nanoarchaeota archaeon]|nr:AccI family restriction endonuclease [Nanoarchaeota archaeon]